MKDIGAVTLMVNHHPRQNQRRKKGKMKRVKPDAGRGVHILIVEDSPTQAEELRHLLEENGFSVAVASNGREALAAVQKQKPAILISDILMPEMDGYALCEKVKSDEKLKDIPVILVTLLSSAQDIVRGLQSGADNFIRKPYDEKYLLSRIDYILVNREVRKSHKMNMGLEIHLGGQKHFITFERQQIVDLLISVYEEAVHINEELKVRQKELTRSNQVLNGLYRIAEGLNRCTTQQGVIDRALDRTLELPNVLSGWVQLREGESNFRVAAARNLPLDLDALGAMENDCLCRRKLLAGELNGALNILECKQLSNAKWDTNAPRYHACVPLWTGDQKLGVMNLVGAGQGEFNDEELKTLYSVGNQVALAIERARLHEHLEELVRKRTSELEWMATHDSLTGFPNCALVLDRLRQAILTAGHENKPIALLLMDLSRFNEVNNTLGHLNGDLLLQQVGSRINGVLRESDALARLEGDRFAIMLPLAESGHATLVANKIIKAMEAPFVLEDIPIAMEMSMGISLYPGHGADADLLLQRADVAVYSAKRRNLGCVIYDAELDGYSPRRLAMMGELRQAIERNQLVLYYQPKVDFKTNTIIGVESLLRWQHPEHDFIPPDQFIGSAEQTGLIIPLTRWVLHEAIRQCRDFHQAEINLNVGINLSVRNLQDPQLPGLIADLLGRFKVDPCWLDLEITESAIMVNRENALSILMPLKKMNIGLSIDDFGTGYSSLGYLTKLPIDTIKIDKSFVIGILASKKDQVVVRSTIDLGHNLGMKVTAEGVENKEVWDQLTALGCDSAQGYYMSRPIPAEELTRWVNESPWGLRKKP